MTLVPLITRRREISKTFRSAVNSEQSAWQDVKYAEICERHLAPLMAANDRFDVELANVDASVRSALRRIEQTR